MSKQFKISNKELQHENTYYHASRKIEYRETYAGNDADKTRNMVLRLKDYTAINSDELRILKTALQAIAP